MTGASGLQLRYPMNCAMKGGEEHRLASMQVAPFYASGLETDGTLGSAEASARG